MLLTNHAHPNTRRSTVLSILHQQTLSFRALFTNRKLHRSFPGRDLVLEREIPPDVHGEILLGIQPVDPPAALAENLLDSISDDVQDLTGGHGVPVLRRGILRLRGHDQLLLVLSYGLLVAALSLLGFGLSHFQLPPILRRAGRTLGGRTSGRRSA